jgi:SP family galactose:H+ symporter-like MFS transporter
LTLSAVIAGPLRLSRQLRRVALIAASCGILLGFNTAVISGALPSMLLTWTLDPTIHSLIVSGLLIGAIVGALVGGRLADDLGRRDVIMATAAVFALGTFCSGLAPSPIYLVGGRLIVGFAVGVISVVAPLYLAEVAPAHRRGAIVGLYQLAITLGILSAYVLDAVLGIHPDEWRDMFMSGAALAGALGLVMLLLPDSPRWMLLHDDEQEARDILARLGVADVDRAIEQIRRGIEQETKAPRALPTSFVRSPLGIGVGLFFFQQLGGINVVIYFFPTMMMRVGLSWGHHALLSAIALGVLNCLLTVVALLLLDRVGRKPLAVWSLAGMFVSLLVLSLGEWLYDHGIAGEAIHIVLFAGFVSYIAWFAVGMGPVCWVMISELYPLRSRGTEMGIPAMAHWAFNLMVAGSLPYILSVGITGYAFLAYAVIAAWGWWWARKVLPETNGLSLEDISARWPATRARALD